jgi:hypothetical protein
MFPARVFPALPRVVAKSTRQRIFFKKIKNCLCRRPVSGTLGTGFSKKKEKQPLLMAFDRGSRHRFKKKIKPPFADGLCQRLSAQIFFKKK